MTVDTKAMRHIKEVLLKFGDKYVEKDNALNDYSLKRSNIINDLNDYNADLITAILNDDFLRKTYTINIANKEIFQVDKFIDMLRFKNYWPDSFTHYNSELGLAVGDRYIDDSSDVVLNFMHKDCVLKAGMTEEDQKNVYEPFLNETLAKSEIDELEEPKILVNATRYDKNGATATTYFDSQDNLIIKGNNLLALHSIVNRYAGKIKLIYLDPPYYFNKNKSADTFAYNTNYKLATWLTFMKNRLEICKKLLRNDGVIVVSIGDDGQAYLKVLMDEIFGQNNFVETFLWKNTDNPDSLSKKSRSGVEYLHAYELKKNSKEKWIGKESENGDAPLLKSINNISERHFPAGSIHFRINDGVYEKGHYPKADLLNDLIVENSVNKNDVSIRGHFVWGQDTIDAELKQGTYFIVKTKNFAIRFQRLNASTMAPEKWIDQQYLSKIFNIGTNEDASSHIKELGFKFNNPKPESLIAFFIRAITKENDIVLDFFMGTGTTQAAALKMHRRFIGIDQMDYIKTIAVPRLRKVIAGEQGEISKDVKWQGGGSFVYAELMEKNQKYLRDIQNAQNEDDLMKIYDLMKGNSDIDFRVDLDKLEKDLKLGRFQTFDMRKRELIHIIDKNQLYYSENNIDDNNVKHLLSTSDYHFNKSFYNKEEF